MSEYKIYVDDKFHAPDLDSPRYPIQVCADYESAVAACKRIVEAFLAGARQAKPEISAQELLEQFAMFGDEPFISPAPEEGGFMVREYVARRCDELCVPGRDRARTSAVESELTESRSRKQS